MPETLYHNEAEKQLIQRSYRKLLRSFKTDLSLEDKHQLRKAYELAVEAHSKQRRKSGEPYILHPIEVARICVEEIGLGPTAATCALLHDVVEDTDVTLKQIHEMFGDRVGLIVDGLTKLDGTYIVSESQQAENFKKVLSTLVQDVRVVLIKMADRLHNLRTIDSMARHKQLKIAAETSFIYAPLAHRLGLYNIKTEFQDLCMRITDRETYDDISERINESKRSRERYISEFIEPLKLELDDLGVKYTVSGRPKSIYSVWNKIKSKKVDFVEIYDLYAIRIIIEAPLNKEKSLCWFVYSIVTSVYKPVPERLKDWISTPKSNGYESLHTTVVGPGGRFVEVQVRSERMDDIAERGYAAHWKYKNVSDKDAYEAWFDNIREMLEHTNSDALEFVADFKTNLFQEEVYVFTPNGDMKMLPKGATALDFAFYIHSDLGYHCQAIKINNKIVPIGYKLQNGDQIEVITNKNKKPNESWLKLVITGKARAKIRNALKEEHRHHAEYGKEALERKFKSWKVDFEDNVDFLYKHLNFRSRGDLYYSISNGEIDLHELKGIKVENGKLTAETVVQPEPAGAEKPVVKTPVSEVKARLLIAGEPADSYEYSLATCCNPLWGDDVFAFLSSNAGMKIHRTTCPNATNLLANYGYRVMKAEWTSSSNASFIVTLVITGVDTGPGVIERVSNKISTQLGLNIRSFYIDGAEGYFQGKISIVVASRDQLNLTIRTLKGLDGVSNVTREE